MTVEGCRLTDVVCEGLRAGDGRDPGYEVEEVNV